MGVVLKDIEYAFTVAKLFKILKVARILLTVATIVFTVMQAASTYQRLHN